MPPLLRSWTSSVTELLNIAARRAAAVAPQVKIDTRIQIGSPTSVLVDASWDGAALVVGSLGLGAFEQFLGSVSVRVATRAHCPVFVVPDHGMEPASQGPIVVGESEFSIAALRFALKEAVLRKTSVRAVTAYQLPTVSIPLEPAAITSLEQRRHDLAVETIETVLGEARTDETQNIRTETVVVQGSTAESILRNAKDAQLIVVGSHGRGPVRRLLLGSVSRRLLYLSVAVVGGRHYLTN